jgi:hypothetical protein
MYFSICIKITHILIYKYSGKPCLIWLNKTLTHMKVFNMLRWSKATEFHQHNSFKECDLNTFQNVTGFPVKCLTFNPNIVQTGTINDNIEMWSNAIPRMYSAFLQEFLYLKASSQNNSII